MDPGRSVQLVEAEKTAELTAYLEKLSGVVNYVNQTFSLFNAAEAVRPKKLLVPKSREQCLWLAPGGFAPPGPPAGYLGKRKTILVELERSRAEQHRDL
jgi:hypothetical protein